MITNFLIDRIIKNFILQTCIGRCFGIFGISWPNISIPGLCTPWIQVRLGFQTSILKVKKETFCFSWWPFFVVIFYLLSPIPTLIAKRHSDGINESSALKEACAFFTTGIVLSAFGLPLVLARAPVAAPTVSFTVKKIYSLY